VVLKRSAPLVLAAVLLAGAGCGDVVSPAIRVGDRTVSHDEALDELESWAANPTVQQGIDLTGGPDRSYPMQLVSEVVSFRIVRELGIAEAERRGLTPVGRQEAQQAFFGQEEQFAAGFDDSYRASLLDDIGYLVALFEELGEEGYSEWVGQALAEERIEVSSRFGSWDPENQTIVPPPGPTIPGEQLGPPGVPGGDAGAPAP
jgi:hypothetical protein